MTRVDATRCTQLNRRPPQSSGHRRQLGSVRPRHIREGTAWLVFDAGGDLFQYQFRSKHSARRSAGQGSDTRQVELAVLRLLEGSDAGRCGEEARLCRQLPGGERPHRVTSQ